MGLHIIDAKHFLPAVENAGSPLYCVDFVNLCRGDPHMYRAYIRESCFVQKKYFLWCLLTVQLADV